MKIRRFVVRMLLVFTVCMPLSSCFICDCFDGMDNAIYFTFISDTVDLNGFSESELDTIFMFRIEKSTGSKIDSFQLDGNQVALYERGPFSGDEKFWNYNYLLQPQSPENFVIRDIKIAGENSGGLCSCHNNTKKEFKVNGTTYNFSGDRAWHEQNVELVK
jgi:hypothetical protein